MNQSNVLGSETSGWDHVPAEFRPDTDDNIVDLDQGLGIHHLFHDNTPEADIETISCGPYNYKVDKSVL